MRGPIEAAREIRWSMFAAFFVLPQVFVGLEEGIAPQWLAGFLIAQAAFFIVLMMVFENV